MLRVVALGLMITSQRVTAMSNELGVSTPMF